MKIVCMNLIWRISSVIWNVHLFIQYTFFFCLHMNERERVYDVYYYYYFFLFYYNVHVFRSALRFSCLFVCLLIIFFVLLQFLSSYKMVDTDKWHRIFQKKKRILLSYVHTFFARDRIWECWIYSTKVIELTQWEREREREGELARTWAEWRRKMKSKRKSAKRSVRYTKEERQWMGWVCKILPPLFLSATLQLLFDFNPYEMKWDDLRR